MPFESEFILRQLKGIQNIMVAGKQLQKAKFRGNDMFVMNTGIGKVNAAHSATCILERFPVRNVINIGIGGAYPGSGLDIGDIALASKEIYGDEGVIDAEGWGSLRKIGIPLVKAGGREYFNEFPAGAIPETIHKDFRTKSGNFVTVSAATGTQKRAGELGKRFNAVCENMEGAAIAHVCAIYGVPFSEIRGISNIAGVRDRRRWSLKRASLNCQQFFLEKAREGSLFI